MHKLVEKINGISLRNILIIPFVIQIVCAVSVVGYLSFRVGQKAVEDLANQLIDETSDRIEKKLEGYLATTMLINQINHDLIQAGNLDATDPERLGKHFWQQLQQFDTVDYIYFANERGGIVSVGRDPNYGFNISVTDGFVSGDFKRYALDAAGDPQTFINARPDFDPRQRGWYQSAAEIGKPVWSDIYPGALETALGISAAQAIDDQRNSVQGVLGTDLLLAQVSDFLQSLQVSQSGKIYIIEHSGLMVAASNEDSLFETEAKNETPQRLNALDSPNQVVAAGTQYLLSRFGELSQITEEFDTRLIIDRERYFLKVIPFQEAGGLNWLAVITVPESDFLADINANTRTTILLCLIALGLAVAIGILTARWVVRPLMRLNQSAKELARGQWEKRIITQRRDEVGELTNAFNEMADRLKESFTTLEQRVAKRTAELEVAREKAEVANQTKSAFIANMSHELRSPLNAILGFTQIMIRSQTLPLEHRENVGIINRSGEHLLTLINNVLDLSKIEAGHTTLNQKSFDLYRLLGDIHDMFQLKANDKGLQLLLELSDALPQYICTDEVKLRQILINLINNALKFTEQGRISLRVRQYQSTDTDDGQITLQFEVEDTGTGIAPDELDQIFEAFTQTKSGQQAQEGTGLGLSISQKFVQLMGGEIQASSCVGAGTIFSFKIQCEGVEATEIDSLSPRHKIIALEPGQLRYRILVVDDKLVNRQLLLRLLSPFGFELQEAKHGKEAIEIWEAWHPHLIWMDMRMPIMDGLEAAQTIKASSKGQETVIIALTASVLEEERALAWSVGCNAVLRKPFRDEQLFKAIEQHLGVRYIYEEILDQPKQAAQKRELLTVENLQTLSPELRQKLRQAVLTSSKKDIAAVVAAIEQENAALSTAIALCFHNFEYETILNLIPKEED
ncbi:cache sensor hybrid histidine kinase [Leptolyngbya sp. Heron Island J]|uniref:ATP-binding protein n=1 Tax=Leptolyngbya sp. Heron Island J TaxID=1385935 RepID=UPI0003B9D88D|nr:ATP-binding protein [Leptolyngbya sp. Heron Island J]ESA36413.1 cache sensor hybrid histidine kinase [Leptolyngbya sp. Heron Island J]